MIHGGDVKGYQERYGREPLDFSANLNPLGMPESIKRAVIAAVEDADRYPDPLCRELSAAVAESESVPVPFILCGNGAADLIYRLALALRPKRALVPVPAFAEYEQALRLAGCQTEFHFLGPERSFLLDETILGKLTGELDLLFLCNPNNPTGQVIPPDLLDQILQLSAAHGITVILDECFQDFLAPERFDSRVRQVKEFPSLVVLKAFTKLYAMAGIRLGYLLCSDAALIKRCAAAGQPWAVSSLAQAAGLAALGETGFRERTQKVVGAERERVKQRLSELGIEVIGSHANYLFFRSPVPDLPHLLEQNGILIRNCDNYRGMPKGYYRAAIRTKDENDCLLEVMEKL